MSELIDKLHTYRCMEEHFYPEDIVTTRDIWELLDEIERLHSIIKEVREYIGIDEELRKLCTIYDVNGIDILEILDKENNNE